MQLVETRAPEGFADLDAVITTEEREEHARSYKQIAGFDVEGLNARPSIVPAGGRT
jgi:5-methylphenazine-1-carboxylate 1-monooxygenase